MLAIFTAFCCSWPVMLHPPCKRWASCVGRTLGVRAKQDSLGAMELSCSCPVCS